MFTSGWAELSLTSTLCELGVCKPCACVSAAGLTRAPDYTPWVSLDVAVSFDVAGGVKASTPPVHGRKAPDAAGGIKENQAAHVRPVGAAKPTPQGGKSAASSGVGTLQAKDTKKGGPAAYACSEAWCGRLQSHAVEPGGLL